jgi:hypothetical protein
VTCCIWLNGIASHGLPNSCCSRASFRYRVFPFTISCMPPGTLCPPSLSEVTSRFIATLGRIRIWTRLTMAALVAPDSRTLSA